MNTDENLDQNIELPKKEDEDVKKQRTRSFLRERFLRIITSLVGKFLCITLVRLICKVCCIY